MYIGSSELRKSRKAVPIALASTGSPIFTAIRKRALLVKVGFGLDLQPYQYREPQRTLLAPIPTQLFRMFL